MAKVKTDIRPESCETISITKEITLAKYKNKKSKISLSIQVSDEITDLPPIRSRVKVICEEPISAYSSRQFDRIASKKPQSYYEACAPSK